MRRAYVLLATVAAALTASAHLCNNIYRTPDRLIVKPEKQVVNVDRSDSFRVFVQNNFPTLVHNLSLSATVEGGGLDVRISPSAYPELAAGQRVSFQVDVTATPGATGGQRSLAFGITGNEVGFQPLHEITNDELNAAFGEGNFSSHVLAATSLAQRRDPRGLAKLRTMTDDRGHRALGLCGDPAAIPLARERLARAQQNGWDAGNLLLALGLLRDQAATFQPYLEHRDPFVRTSAAAGMVLAGHETAALTGALRTALRHEDVLVRTAAAWALAAKGGDRESLDVLDAAFRPSDPKSRVFAGDALVDLAGRTAPRDVAAVAAPAPAPAAAPAPPVKRAPTAAPAPAPPAVEGTSWLQLLLLGGGTFAVTSVVLYALAGRRRPRRR